MGNSQSIYIYSVTDPRSISMDHLEKTTDSSNRKVWKNPSSGVHYEQLLAAGKQPKALEHELVLYERRRQQEIGLPVVHYVQKVDSSDSSARSNKEFKVFVEFSPIRLTQISTLSLPSSLFLLQKAFVALNGLFKETGYFDVKQDFIGINKDGQPRFWCNSSWAVNQPESVSQRSGNLTYLEGLMVEKIFEIIEARMDNQEVHSYIREKQKIKQWTFELASAFIQYFIKSQEIELPSRLTNSEKNLCTQRQSLTINPTNRRQFSLKNPKYSIMINLPEVIPSQLTGRLNLAGRNMFDSIYQKNQKPQYLNVKNDDTYSPKSIDQRSRITGLNFKQSFCNNYRNKTVRNQHSGTKSCFGLSKFGLKNVNTSQQSKLEQKIQHLKQSKHEGDKSFITNRRKQSYMNISFTKNSQIETEKKQYNTQQKLETQSISNSFIHKFRGGKEKGNKQLVKKSSLNETKKCQNNLMRGRENTYNSSTLQSSEFHSPIAKSKISVRNELAETRTEMMFSQEIYQHMTTSNQIKKQPKTALPMSRGLSVEITEFKEEISQYILQDDIEEGKAVMTESILLDELVVQNKNNNKPLLGMLDQLMMKKAIQKISGQLNQQQEVNMKNPNVMAQSIIEPL